MFGVYKPKMHVNLFSDNNFHFLKVENDINKNRLNLINLRGQKLLKEKYLLLDQQCS